MTLSKHFCLTIIFSLALSFSALAGKPAPTLPRKHIPVPIMMQATDYSCGAAALLSVLYYWEAYEGTESSLYPMLHTTPEHGTEPGMMASVAKELGLEASFKEGMTLDELREGLDRGDTIILDIQAWHEPSTKVSDSPNWREIWEDGHYVVLIAMDKTNAYFMDSSAGISYGFIPIPELLDRWHDFEDRNGRMWRYYNLGITISGKKPIKKFPDALVRIE